MDDFREVNKKIFDFEEKEMESNKAYRILSLLCVSLLDLGLLEIEEVNLREFSILFKRMRNIDLPLD